MDPVSNVLNVLLTNLRRKLLAPFDNNRSPSRIPYRLIIT